MFFPENEFDFELDDGQIFESNSYVIQAMLEKFGAQVLNLGQIADDPESIKQAFLTAQKNADVVITSGGVSVGDADYVKQVLEEIGQINFWKLAIKPGKPFAFGLIGHKKDELNQCQFFGLPGNPVSSTVTLHQLVLPVLRVMTAESEQQELVLTAKVQEKFKKRPGRTDYQRGLIYSENGQLLVSSVGQQGSGLMNSISKANCFVRLERHRGHVEIGESVEVIFFDSFI